MPQAGVKGLQDGMYVYTACPPHEVLSRIYLIYNIYTMKKYILMACIALLTAGHTAQAQVPQTLDGGYRPVWNDEFETPGRPDPANWVYEYGFVRNKEWQWYQSDNATVTEDGVLQITARTEDRPCPWYEKRKQGLEAQPPQDRMHLCLRQDAGTARVPLWPHTGEGTHPRSPRVVACHPDAGKQGGIWLAVVWRTGHHGVLRASGRAFHPGQRLLGRRQGRQRVEHHEGAFHPFHRKGLARATRFHVWRTDWDENHIRIYLDDELLNEIDLSKTVNGKHGHGDNPFHQPMHLLLNMAMGSSGGKVDAEAMPMRYEVDYVRVYQK